MRPTFGIFRKASRRLSGGWVQGLWYDDAGNVCMLQAVIDALGIKQSEDDSKNAALPWAVLVEIDATLMGTATYCASAEQEINRRNILSDRNVEQMSQLIWTWNDAPGRTKDEVLDVLRATADRLEDAARPLMQKLIARAIRPKSWFYVEDEDLAYAGTE